MAAQVKHLFAFRSLERRLAMRVFAAILALTAILAVATLSACSNFGEYNASEITAVVESYYNNKYDDNATVVDISEETETGLFGTSSLGNFFCTMSDGNIVFYDEDKAKGEKSPSEGCKDNRQSAEIVAAYISYLHKFEQTATKHFLDAGYQATVEIDDWHNLSNEEIGECIAYEDWEFGDTDFSGSYFHTKLENQGDAYILEEKQYSSLWIKNCNAYISGPDAAYADAFPTNVPETPAWQEVANAVSKDFKVFSDGLAHIEVYQASNGTRDTKEVQLGDGFINAYEDAWIIYDYIDCGDGIWVTSDEYGLRLTANDLELAESTDAPTMAELIEDGSTPKTMNPSAYKAYSLKLSDEATKRAQSTLDEVGNHGGGWVSLNFAFDAASVTYSDGSPYPDTIRLYSVEKNRATSASTTTSESGGRSASTRTSDNSDGEQGDAEQENSEQKYALSTITYSKEPLPNGMISGAEALYIDDALIIVRL